MDYLSWQLAHDVWTEIIDGFLVQNGRCANRRKGETPRQLIGGYLIHRLTTHKQYHQRGGLLAPDIHARRRGVDRDEHVQNEADVYVQVLFRRVMLTSQRSVDKKTGAVVKERPDLTNTHQLLLGLVKFCSMQPEWQQASLIRIPGSPTLPPGDDVLFTRVGAALKRLYDAEQRRHDARAQAEGKVVGEVWGFGDGSASPSWIKGYCKDGQRPEGTWGQLYLKVGSMLAPVPEELSFADVFDCLPGSLDRSLMLNFAADAAQVRALALGVRKAEESLGNDLTPGYRVWMLFRSLIQDLNDPYGAMVAAGIPSSAMFDMEGGFNQRLSFGECGFLKRLREQAFELARTRAGASCGGVASAGVQESSPKTNAPTVEEWMANNKLTTLPTRSAINVNVNDWAEAWRIMEAGRLTKGQYDRDEFGGFDGFRQSPEGMALLNITEVPLAGSDENDEEEGQTYRAFVEPEVEREDIRHLIAKWTETASMTASELELADAASGGGVGGTLYRPLSDPTFVADIVKRSGREIPYSLLPAGADRVEVLRFFFERRFCLLRDLGCRPVNNGWRPVWSGQGSLPMTKAEEEVLAIVQEMNDKSGNPDRDSSHLLQDQILRRLRTDTKLARLLNRFPYSLAPEESRLKLMLFFYTRDVESRLVRSV